MGRRKPDLRLVEPVAPVKRDHRTTTPPTGLPVHRPAHDPEVEVHVISNPAIFNGWRKA